MFFLPVQTAPGLACPSMCSSAGTWASPAETGPESGSLTASPAARTP